MRTSFPAIISCVITVQVFIKFARQIGAEGEI